MFLGMFTNCASQGFSRWSFRPERSTSLLTRINEKIPELFSVAVANSRMSVCLHGFQGSRVGGVRSKFILWWVVWMHGRQVECERGCVTWNLRVTVWKWSGSCNWLSRYMTPGSWEWLCGREVDYESGWVDAWQVDSQTGCVEDGWIMREVI